MISSVSLLVIDESAIAGRDLVRMAELSDILVSARLRDAIESAGMTGLEFGEIEDYRELPGG